jgi:hypothetical protein
MIIKKRPSSSKYVCTNDVKSETGKEIVLNNLKNHYKTLLNAKSHIKIEEPKKMAAKIQSKKTNKGKDKIKNRK